MRHILLAVCLLAVTAGAGWAQSPDAPEATEYELRLFDALFRGDEPTPDSPTLLLWLRRDADGWGRVWGIARTFTDVVQWGRVVESDLEADPATLTIEMRIQTLGLAPAERARYEVELIRQADGKLAGTHDGTFRGIATSGEATLQRLPSRQIEGEDAPAKPGEHPRILFRKKDLPALREKAKTPFGQAAMKKLSGPAGLALKYQLTGEKKYAEQAIPLIRKMITRGTLSDQYGHNIGVRLTATALAYDMCYDVWPEEWKREVEEYMAWTSEDIMYDKGSMNRGINWRVASNWSAPIWNGLGMAGLALRGEKGDTPAKPAPTHSGEKISRAEGEPGKGVPISKLKSGEMPPDWIYVGPFDTYDDSGPLEAMGGAGDVQPAVDKKVTWDGETSTWRPVSEKKDEGYWQNENYMGGRKMIDITNAADRDVWTTSYFYSVVENNQPRWMQVQTGFQPATVYLNGTPLKHGEVAYIPRGQVRMLVQAPIDWVVPWGRQLMQPKLVDISADEAEQLAARHKQRYQEHVADWRQDLAAWEAGDGASPRYEKIFQTGRVMMYLFAREAVGTGGTQAEITHYGNIATKEAAPYYVAYRTMTGKRVTPQNDVELILPERIFLHVYREGKEPLSQEINTQTDLDGEWFARLYPVTPEKYQPAALWAWREHAKDGGDNGAETDWIDEILARDTVRSFVYYPLDAEASQPGEVMPLTWEAPDFGLYAFRNAWDDPNAFLAQVWAKDHVVGGWNGPNAGTFRLLGLGHKWAVGPHDRHRMRWEEPLVQLPEDEDVINQSALGEVTYAKTRSDGSGVVSIDLRDVYAAAHPLPDRPDRKQRLYEHYGHIRRESAFKDSGITGMRSVAVDYSGLSGAPCLMVVVDQIDGGGQKVWTWQLGEENLADTTVEGNAFTVAKSDGAKLRGTVISSG
ncbi:MAG: hypothetical protein ACOC93_01720, partial [Planctomycetota bacterium]